MEIRATAELDFGVLCYIRDPETRRRRPLWVLLVRMGRDAGNWFLWPTRTQKLDDVVAGLEAAWDYYGDVPCRLVVNSYPVSVGRAASPGHRLTPGFLEYAQYRGFTVDFAREVEPPCYHIYTGSPELPSRQILCYGTPHSELGFRRNARRFAPLRQVVVEAIQGEESDEQALRPDCQSGRFGDHRPILRPV